ncbi:uncharacterized protein Fot_48690 [Forsythia ovata]|uniref:Uncharacterized protein n=1 Tax=Forsythia ovata TaxID=205694 RepID=A0ABD1Q9R1_9LAMI
METSRRRRRWVGSGLVATSLRQWKFDDRVPTRDFIPVPTVSVSARKIAAGLWKFASTTGGSRWRYGLFHQLGLKKEKKGREFLKEVCNDLNKEIDKEKAEIGALKSEHGRILEKVEEERKMLQLVEA